MKPASQPFRQLSQDEARPLYAAGRVAPLTYVRERKSDGKRVRVSSDVPGSFLAFVPDADGARRLYRVLPA